MIKSYNINFNLLNKFLKKIILEKQYLKILKKKIYLLSIVRRKKCIYLLKNNSSINYTIDIFFSQTNTLLHIIDFSGKLKFSCSAGKILYKKNNKKAHILILKLIISHIVKNYSFLKKKTIALHLKNVKFLKSWIVSKFKKKFMIQTIKNFNIYSYNGCRKKKIKRKK